MKKLVLIFFVLTLLVGLSHTLYTHKQTADKNHELKTKIALLEEETKAAPPPPRVKELIIANKDGSPVKKIRQVDNTEVEEFEKNQQIKVELIGVLKLQINENNSWETISKMLVLLLVSYGGIKTINRIFEDTK